MKKYIFWLGIIAAIFYTAGVVIGGALIPNYSHINQAISEIDPLISKNYRFIIIILFGLYNICTLVYGILLYILFKDKGYNYKAQSLGIIIISLGGLLMNFFPMDIVGAPTTENGIIHIVLAGIMAPLTILICALGFKNFKSDKRMRIYSLLTSIIIIICGGLSAFLVSKSVLGMGVFERITIGSYILWLLVTGLYYNRRSN